MTNKELGQYGESKACEYLCSNEYELVARNVRTRYGELDIIAKKAGILIVIEVKTRRSKKYGLPCEAVTALKQNHIRRSTELYLEQYSSGIYRFVLMLLKSMYFIMIDFKYAI